MADDARSLGGSLIFLLSTPATVVIHRETLGRMLKY
jgi:hypothetical protein